MKLQIAQKDIESKIFTFRNTQVMIDTELAEMYGVETKRLNEQVKRNSERFPESFRFRLSNHEKDELVANCDRFKNLKFSSSNPYVFTEQGVAMLSAVLRSEVAIKVSLQIMSAFVQMRKLIGNTSLIDLRLSKLERKEIETEQRFEQVFKALESGNVTPKQGVFFDGQIFDAYTFVADIIRTAKHSVILIDNYVDDSVLTLLSKRKAHVKTTIYTQKIEKQLQLDVKKYNQQYPEIHIQILSNVHDRFLLIDQLELYHIGASLKDLGKKWFAFSKMNDFTSEILKRIQQ